MTLSLTMNRPAPAVVTISLAGLLPVLSARRRWRQVFASAASLPA